MSLISHLAADDKFMLYKSLRSVMNTESTESTQSRLENAASEVT